MAQSTSRPLRELRVIEHATFVAGPSAGMGLAQLGATVIRVDPPGGSVDIGRWPVDGAGHSIYWANLNKGKLSVAIDHRTREGRELLLALVTAPGGGVYVDNHADRKRVSYDELKARRDDVIHVHFQGFADNRPAVDYTVNAGVGIASMTGPHDATRPYNHVLPAWDLLAGAHISLAVVTAVLHRHLTGEGAAIELSLADVAVSAVSNLGWLDEAHRNGSSRPPVDNFVYGTYGADFTTADGARVMVMALSPGQWHALCRLTGTTDAMAALANSLDVDLDDEGQRYLHREPITDAMRHWFAARALAQVGTELDNARIVWGAFRSMAQAAQAAPAEYPHLVGTIEQPGIGKMLAASTPIRWSAMGQRAQPAPRLGADTEQVLSETVGLSSAEIGALADRGIIAVGEPT